MRDTRRVPSSPSFAELASLSTPRRRLDGAPAVSPEGALRQGALPAVSPARAAVGRDEQVAAFPSSKVADLIARAEAEGIPAEYVAQLRELARRPRAAPPPVDRSRLLSASDVRRRVGVGATTLWRWIRAGSFPRPRYTPGGQRRWGAEEVEQWEAGLRTQRGERT